ncbi:MAG TPA: type II secretion system F family protein [Candidatus Limnocylindrales bacterium]|nr:type II secretion system F family protein [Candidatus Limnocylindrales bacterium]
MIAGAAAAGLCVALLIVAARGDSGVERRLHLIERLPSSPRRREVKGDLALARVAGALCGCLVGCALSYVAGLGLLPIPIAAYAGLVGPSVIADRRATSLRREADRVVIVLVEWLHALVASGRPIETAMTTVSAGRTGNARLDISLARVQRDYALGVPLRDALKREGLEAQIGGLVELGKRLDRARDLGRAVLPVLQDLRDQLRSAERARALQAASHVEGKLTLVLTLCYLPALALLVIIPLFVTLLAGLFA